MEIKDARFVISNTDVAKCPAGDRPEYAFIGRSNVGKSSLINMLTGRKGLAMTSSTPGKTMLINHFDVDGSWYIEFMEWLGENGVPFAIVFPKADKLGVTVLRDKIEAYKTRLLEDWEELPPIFITSSETRKGKEELLDYIGSLNETMKNTPRE